jgi:carboxypeptidase C (cathepsin A)
MIILQVLCTTDINTYYTSCSLTFNINRSHVKIHIISKNIYIICTTDINTYYSSRSLTLNINRSLKISKIIRLIDTIKRAYYITFTICSVTVQREGKREEKISMRENTSGHTQWYAYHTSRNRNHNHNHNHNHIILEDEGAVCCRNEHEGPCQRR